MALKISEEAKVQMPMKTVASLIALVAILIFVKPFSEEQRQFFIYIYPKLDNWSKWFFRTPEN